MPDFTKPRFARGNQLIVLLAEANLAGFRCVKLEVLGGAKYRCHFMRDDSLKINYESCGQTYLSSVKVNPT